MTSNFNIQSGASTKFAICGGGIGGLTLAVALQQKGYHVKAYESAPEIKPLGAGLALAANAMKAFATIGLDGIVTEHGKVIKKFCIKDQKGRVISVTDSEAYNHKYNVVNNFTIHRAALHDVLIRSLRENTLQLNKRCVDFAEGVSGVTIRFEDGSSAEADYLIACDGIHSPIRKKLLPDSELRYAGYTCWRGISHGIPEGMNPEETSETWGADGRFGITPLADGKIYWYACVNAVQNDNKYKSYSIYDLFAYFGAYHFPIPEILKMTPNENVIWNDILDLNPIRRYAFGRVVLLGDAAHATTPNMGQGACMAIEDAVILANCIHKFPSVEKAFTAYEQRRLPRTTRIVDTSWRIGKIAQIENPLVIFLRNTLMRMSPARMVEKQMEFIYDVSFH